MLEVNDSYPMASSNLASSEPNPFSVFDYVEWAIGFLIRQAWVIIFTIVITCAAVGTYFFLASPHYKATATVVIDAAKFQLFQPVGEVSIESSAAVESQLEILRSEKLALEVIKQLHLADNPQTAPAEGWFGQLFGHRSQPTPYEHTRAVLAGLQKHLTVRRLGAAWMIEISYESRDPEQAAVVANAVAEAYIADQLEGKYQTTRQASTWLEGRLKDLREQMMTAQRAVVEFKSQNNIVDAGGGRLVSDQQLSELNSQLAVARAQASEAKARYDRVSAIGEATAASGTVSVPVTDTQLNDTIAKLRSRLLELANKESDWSAKFGSQHLAVVNLRNQIAQLRAAILDELNRIGGSYKNDYDLALSRVKNLEQELDQVIVSSENSSRAQVRLRELESSAQTSKGLYDSLLKRYMESMEQQSYPVTEARVITRAVRPLDREYKTMLKILAVMLGGGMSFGFGIAVLREISDQVFRTVDQLENRLRSKCLTLVPKWKPDAKKVKPDVAPSKNSQPELPGARTIADMDAPIRSIVDSPLSAYAEALRTLKLEIDLHGAAKKGKVVGLTSSLPKEGKSTLSASLAFTMGYTDARVILIDFDLRNPTLSRMLAPNAGTGLIEVATGKIPLADAIWMDQTRCITFLPAVLSPRFVQTNELIASNVIKTLLNKLRTEYDYIVVDLPPLAPIVDTRATTHLIDSYIFVVEWGVTKTNIVEYALRRAPGVAENLLGVVLNKVDMKLLQRYDRKNVGYYSNKHYAQYGYVE
jgi:polysaccharide biosynthesis transport protein